VKENKFNSEIKRCIFLYHIDFKINPNVLFGVLNFGIVLTVWRGRKWYITDTNDDSTIEDTNSEVLSPENWFYILHHLGTYALAVR
jgi:hypothetical protein